MIETACNRWVLIIRDEAPENLGFDVPEEGRVKPHYGTIQAVGNLVQDEGIRAAKGKKAIFYPTVGWEIPYGGVTYVVVRDEEIICLP